VTAPVPEPPVVVKLNAAPKIPVVDVSTSGDWAALANVTMVGAEEIGR
jgi:hypothetical protein